MPTTTRKLIPFTGRDAISRALHASARATSDPGAYPYRGGVVGMGDEMLRRKGTRDVRLYGARGTSVWRSEVRS